MDRCQTCVDAGLVKPVDASIMGHSIWALCHGVVSLVIAKPQSERPEANELFDHLIGAYLNGMRA